MPVEANQILLGVVTKAFSYKLINFFSSFSFAHHVRNTHFLPKENEKVKKSKGLLLNSYLSKFMCKCIKHGTYDNSNKTANFIVLPSTCFDYYLKLDAARYCHKQAQYSQRAIISNMSKTEKI